MFEKTSYATTRLFHQRRIPILLFFVFVLISHFALPVFNDGEDWFPFASWQMFAKATMPKDITWDQGRIRLLRDRRSSLRKHGVNIKILVFQINTEDFTALQRHKPQLLKICQCTQLEFVRLNGHLYEHIILKKDLPIQTRQSL